MITTATKITIMRLVLVPIFLLMAILDFKYHFLIAGLIYSVIAITDFLDGFVARRTNTVSKLGKILDPIADKLLSISGLLCAVCYKLFFHSVAPAVLVALIVFREGLVSAMRALVLKHGYVLAADVFGKIKTIFINIAVPITFLSASLLNDFGYDNFVYPFFKGLGTALFMLGFIFTMISCIRYFYINREIIKLSWLEFLASEKGGDAATQGNSQNGSDSANNKPLCTLDGSQTPQEFSEQKEDGSENEDV